MQPPGRRSCLACPGLACAGPLALDTASPFEREAVAQQSVFVCMTRARRRRRIRKQWRGRRIFSAAPMVLFTASEARCSLCHSSGRSPDTTHRRMQTAQRASKRVYRKSAVWENRRLGRCGHTGLRLGRRGAMEMPAAQTPNAQLQRSEFFPWKLGVGRWALEVESKPVAHPPFPNRATAGTPSKRVSSDTRK